MLSLAKLAGLSSECGPMMNPHLAWRQRCTVVQVDRQPDDVIARRKPARRHVGVEPAILNGSGAPVAYRRHPGWRCARAWQSDIHWPNFDSIEEEMRISRCAPDPQIARQLVIVLRLGNGDIRVAAGPWAGCG